MNINLPLIVIIFIAACFLVIFGMIFFEHWKYLKTKRTQEKYFRDKYGKF